MSPHAPLRWPTGWSRIRVTHRSQNRLTFSAAPPVYQVEPTGPFENDPNVTDKKFPGNPTRSYRSADPLRIVSEVLDWTRLTPEALQQWRERLAALDADHSAEIIN